MGIPPVEPCTLAVSGHKKDNLLVSVYSPPNSKFMNSTRRFSNLQRHYHSRVLSNPRRRIRHH